MGFKSIKNLAHPRSQSFCFTLQRISYQQARKSRVLLGKVEKQPENRATLLDRSERICGTFDGVLNPVDPGEQTLLDELDQPLEHLRLAWKVPIKRGLRYSDCAGQIGCGDTVARIVLQHHCQRFENLLLAIGSVFQHCHGSTNLRADAGVGEDLQQQRMGHGAIDDLHAANSFSEGIHRTLNFWQHA